MNDNGEALCRRRVIESLIEQVYAAPAGPGRDALVARLALEEARAAVTLAACGEGAGAADDAAAGGALSQVLADMSRELATPLGCIVGYAELLEGMEDLPQDARTYVRRIAAASQSLLSLSADLLEVSRLRAGRLVASGSDPSVPCETKPRAAHILIVDDLARNRALVRAMLAPLGHSFEEAADGMDAVSAASGARFDLILMDVHMPRMDGLAATRAIRAGGGVNRGTPILAFSSNVVLPEQIEAARAAGMNDHIGKPVQPAELIAKVAMWACERDERAR